MNVIPFPAAAPSTRVVLERLVAALQTLGEPAKTAEIAAILSFDSAAEVEATLVRFCRDSPPWFEGDAVFRPVDLRGESAWAFTSQFRTLLREGGLPPALRGR